MLKNLNIRHLRGKNRRAFTLLESIISIAIFTMVGIAEVSLIVMTARIHNEGFVEMLVFKHADYIQDRVTGLLQGGSRESGVFFADPDGAFYRRILFRQSMDSSPQELRFDPNTHKLTYDPDVSIPNNEVTIQYQGAQLAQLDDVCFRAAMKIGGIPDNSVLLVQIRVSDHGKGRSSYRDPHNEYNWITSRRHFAVCLRRQ